MSLVTGPAWRSGPAPVRALPDEVHLWSAALGEAGDRAAVAEELGAEERARGDLGTAGWRFAQGRALTRRILARYLGCPPSAVPIGTAPGGKPRLDGGDPRLRFNLSHAGDRLLVAIASGVEVGVDLERIAPGPVIHAVADRFLAPAERATLLASPAELRAHRFFTIWTRKEAYVKLRGTGVGDSLERFAVSADPAALDLIVPASDGKRSESVVIRSVEMGDGFAAAVAFPAPDRTIRRWRLASDPL